MKTPRFVPRIVFTTAVVGVSPACHPTGRGSGEVIVLAVAGYASGGSAGTGGVATGGESGAGPGGAGGATGRATGGNTTVPVPTPSANRPPEPHVIVLAVQGFRGKGGRGAL